MGYIVGRVMFEEDGVVTGGREVVAGGVVFEETLGLTTGEETGIADAVGVRVAEGDWLGAEGVLVKEGIGLVPVGEVLFEVTLVDAMEVGTGF